MIQSRTDLTTIFLLALLLWSLGPVEVALSKEAPLDLEENSPSLFVPAGDIVDNMGFLFSQMQLNGGVEIYFTQRAKSFKVGEFGSGPEPARPGVPWYLQEFVTRKTTMQKVLDDYCRANKHINWVLRDDVLNIRTRDIAALEKNPLDVKVKKVVFPRASSLGDCLNILTETCGEQWTKDGADVTLYWESDQILGPFPNALHTIRIPRSQHYKDKTVRQILNSLVKPHINIVWICYLWGEEENKRHFSLGIGICRPPEVCYSVQAILREIISSVDRKTYEVRYVAVRDYALWLYFQYKKDPERTVQLFDQEIGRVKDEKTKKLLLGLKAHLEKDFSEYRSYSRYPF